MAWTGNWRRAAAGVLVLAAHALLVLYAYTYVFSPPAHVLDKEIVLTLPPLPKPVKQEAAPVPETRPAANTHTPLPITVPKDWVPPRWTPREGTALQDLGSALGCGAYDTLDETHRAACKHGPWKNDSEARETASLIIKAPHVMTHAERAERIRDTVDPCAAEKLTHQTDCIFKIIYGNDKLP